MKVLITGASGFIGKNLLLSMPLDWKVIATYNESTNFNNFIKTYSLDHIIPFKVDLLKKDNIGKLLKMTNHFDCCVYLAANGDPAVSVREPAYDLLSNTLTLVNLLEQISFDKFIYFSSGAVYHGIKGAVTPSIPVNPSLPYGISNLASENYVNAFQKEGRIQKAIVVRFFGAYGPFEPGRKIFSKLVKSFGIDRNGIFTIRGDGCNLIDAMYVDDTIRAIHILIKNDIHNNTIDLFSGHPMTIKDLVESAAHIFNINAEILHQGESSEYIEFFSTHNFLSEKYGFYPNISLETGLLSLLSHFKSKNI